MRFKYKIINLNKLHYISTGMPNKWMLSNFCVVKNGQAFYDAYKYLFQNNLIGQVMVDIQLIYKHTRIGVLLNGRCGGILCAEQ